jgi:hypothetical protein
MTILTVGIALAKNAFAANRVNYGGQAEAGYAERCARQAGRAGSGAAAVRGRAGDVLGRAPLRGH